MVIPIMVQEEDRKDPEVLVSKCCEKPTGLLVRVNGAWWLVRDQPTTAGQLATHAFRVAVCRGCYRKLTDETPTESWIWQTDAQLEDHFRSMSREQQGG